MMITVRYGENQTVVINANCKNNILLEHLKERCDCSTGDHIDLSDENGNIKFLQKNPTDYGCDYLSDRETLILLKVDIADDRPVYVPLVKDLEEDAEFIEKLNPREAQKTKRGKSKVVTQSHDDDARRAAVSNRRGSKGNVLQRRKSVSNARTSVKLPGSSSQKIGAK